MRHFTQSHTKKVDAVCLISASKNQRELRPFLRLLNYYGKFMPNLATLIHPLNSLLKTNAHEIGQNNVHGLAFNVVRDNLT